MIRAAVLLALLAASAPVAAQVSSTLPYTGTSAVLPGTYTLATLPGAAANQGRYAFVTDLGGGPDMVLSDGTNWKHIRMGTVTPVPIAATITVTPLASPPIMQLTGSAFTALANVQIATAGLYSGYTLHVVVPSGVLSTVAGALGSIGVSAGGGTALPVVGGTWEDFQWNGITLVEIGKGTL